MKFLIFVSMAILIISQISMIATISNSRSHTKKIKKSKNPGTTVIHKSYSSPVGVRPSFVSSPKLFTSGTPKGPMPRPVLVSSTPSVGFPIIRNPRIGLRKIAVIRYLLDECPPSHHTLLLIDRNIGECFERCTKNICIQLKEFCCYYDEDVFKALKASAIAN